MAPVNFTKGKEGEEKKLKVRASPRGAPRSGTPSNSPSWVQKVKLGRMVLVSGGGGGSVPGYFSPDQGSSQEEDSCTTQPDYYKNHFERSLNKAKRNWGHDQQRLWRTKDSKLLEMQQTLLKSAIEAFSSPQKGLASDALDEGMGTPESSSSPLMSMFKMTPRKSIPKMELEAKAKERNVKKVKSFNLSGLSSPRAETGYEAAGGMSEEQKIEQPEEDADKEACTLSDAFDATLYLK